MIIFYTKEISDSMQFLMFKIVTMLYTGIQFWYRATPFIVQFTAGGADQMISAAAGAGLILTRQIMKKSAALLKRQNTKMYYSLPGTGNFRLA